MRPHVFAVRNACPHFRPPRRSTRTAGRYRVGPVGLLVPDMQRDRLEKCCLYRLLLVEPPQWSRGSRSCRLSALDVINAICSLRCEVLRKVPVPGVNVGPAGAPHLGLAALGVVLGTKDVVNPVAWPRRVGAIFVVEGISKAAVDVVGAQTVVLAIFARVSVTWGRNLGDGTLDHLTGVSAVLWLEHIRVPRRNHLVQRLRV
mmetsp:Transcript_8179/g.24093  ORF Transcript_8179/g.24093 Transcript_8179/m.24093 type:complete len:202 (+) Transcript_8179:122-727(+)